MDRGRVAVGAPGPLRALRTAALGQPSKRGADSGRRPRPGHSGPRDPRQGFRRRECAAWSGRYWQRYGAAAHRVGVVYTSADTSAPRLNGPSWTYATKLLPGVGGCCQAVQVDDGIYEALLTKNRRRALDALAKRTEIAAVDPADQPHVLARHVSAVVENALRSQTTEKRIQMLNRLLGALQDDLVLEPVEQLLSVTTEAQAPPRPTTPLAEAALLTNTRDEPSLAGELRAEIGSADGVDLICAFVRWHGVRLLEDDLRELRRRGRPFRVITTTYLGSTERRALDRLADEFGADIRVQYDASRTRLHAKAWLFRRNSGYDTAYVGSSNLSRAALLDGVEWNVRLSSVGTLPLIQKFEATFDSYWNDPAFEPYLPERDRDRLDDALLEAGGGKHSERVTVSLSHLEVRPYPYQQVMLDEIEAERLVHDHHRNLIVAATGTGKTVVAALDYRRLDRSADGERPKLLFVAHRREILEQALRTYREVLNDPTFGSPWFGGQRPERWKHVFASVQSLSSYGVTNIRPDAFDVVVIDEFHHAQAPTYRAILDQLVPTELLGLTATPERADGLDVRAMFGGRIATELRLWDAIGADLLVPFHYFAAADGTDLSGITWRRGFGYDVEELGHEFVNNDARSAVILSEVADKVLDPGGMRALGFCVTVQHAMYMARVFNEAGIRAAALSASSTETQRASALSDLRAGRINVVFAVDLFNEGLDIPEIDTILMLRPTSSATVFLQQLGRGLRRTADKAVLTVLDFVGLTRKEFSFANQYRALTGLSRGRLRRAIEAGFPFMPPGCQIVLDRQAQEIVLENIKSQVAPRWSQVVAEARELGDVSLPEFLEASDLALSDVVRGGTRSWTELRRSAGLTVAEPGPREAELLKRIRALAHVDDPLRTAAYKRLLAGEEPTSPVEQRLAEMLFYSLWPNGGGYGSVAEGLRELRSELAVRRELKSVVGYSFDQAHRLTSMMVGELSDIPLAVHAHYQREEVLSAIGYSSLRRKPNSFREGVLYAPDRNIDGFFVTLKKSEADYSPTTMYRDYPIDRWHFHWESQSTTSVRSPVGRRYLEGSSTVLLFVRPEQRNDFGTAPYMFLGPVTYVSHTGDRPIAIKWKLQSPMPADFFQAATVAAA